MSCQDNTCLNGGTCLTDEPPPFKICDCSNTNQTDQTGPRCQGLKHSFTLDRTSRVFQSNALLPARQNLHLSLEFAVNQSGNFTLFYAEGSEDEIIKIDLTLNRVNLSLRKPGDYLSRNVKFHPEWWNRVDIYVDQKQSKVVIMSNRCVETDCAGTRSLVEYPQWDSGNMTISLGGMHNDSASNYSGCIKNLRVNGELISLFQRGSSQNGCAREGVSIVASIQCGPGGYAVGLLDQNKALCNCYPGYTQKSRSSPCDIETTSFHVSSDNTVQWDVRDDWTDIVLSYYENFIQKSFRRTLLTSFRFRTTQSQGRLLYMETLRNATLTIKLEQGNLVTEYVNGQQKALVNFNATRLLDGEWHSVMYSRIGPTVEVLVDDGEGERYGTYFPDNIDPNTTPLELGDIGLLTLVEVGPNFEGCFDDVRLFARTLNITKSKSPPTLPCSTEYKCPTNQTNVCAANERCAPAKWPNKYNCWNKEDCRLKGNECLNGGKCVVGSLKYVCSCLPGFLAPRCIGSDPSDPYAKSDFEWWWILIGIVAFLLLVMIITVIYCCCCSVYAARKKKRADISITKNQLETPRGNIGPLDVNGAADEDYPGALRFSIFSPNEPAIVTKAPNLTSAPTPKWLVSNESLPAPMPELDHPLEYAFEGHRLSTASSLSNLTSSEDEDANQLNALPLNQWGPQFAPFVNLFR